MPTPTFELHACHLQGIREAALEAADAGACVFANLSLQGHRLRAGRHRLKVADDSRIFLVALGKAAADMCEAAAGVLGDSLTEGVAAVPHFPARASPDQLAYIPAGHPLPDEGSLAAGSAVEQMLRNTKRQDTVVVLVSGGGSAMMELPLEGIALSDLLHLNELLLRSGAPIQATNAVRSALSRVKAGGVARLAAPAQVVGLILSDVLGDRLSTIASGPTILRRPDPAAAAAILKSYNLWSSVGAPIRQALRRPREIAAGSPRPINLLVGSSRQVLAAAANHATEFGFAPRIVTRRMRGEARDVGHQIAMRVIHFSNQLKYPLGRSRQSAAQRGRAGACLLLAGETTVTVHGKGKGGRCQELALSAARALDGMSGVALMAFGTDGVDGPTDAAGAVITGDTARLCREAGLNLEAALADNNAYPVLDSVRALLRTGPTGTNLGDLVVGLIYPGACEMTNARRGRSL